MAGQKFPKYPLEDAVMVARAAYQQGKACKLSTLAAALNYTPSTGTFKQKKAAATWFGLIEIRDDETVTATDLARSIISPLDDAEQTRARAQAFLKYELFSRFYSHIPTGVDLTIQRMANIAERECGIEVDNKEAFVRVFAQSGEFAGVLIKKTEDYSVMYKPHGGDNFEPTLSGSATLPSGAEENPAAQGAFDSQDKQTLVVDEPRSTPQITGFPTGLSVTLNVSSDTPIEVVQLILDRILMHRKDAT